ncbi:MAG: DUF2130 domain-containing protein [Chitinophagaceae bacterium]|nr:DUF2130 domain-containing protein [Chitinophagaceae bacterium]
MTSTITCPNCGHSFEPTIAMRDEIEKHVQQELRAKAADWQKKKEEEYKNKENNLLLQLQQKDSEIEKRISEEKKKIQSEVEERIRKNIAGDYENQLKVLQDTARDSDEKLKQSRKKELEFLQKEQEYKNKEAELELTIQKKLQVEREKMSVDIRQIEAQRIAQLEADFLLKLKEKDKQMEDQKKLVEDQKKLVDEMRRKAEQGSTQLQGEIQELALEELLQKTFPFDTIEEVAKGIRGADCTQQVRNQFGQEAGKIIYESKRTKEFSGEWIEKLKADMRSLNADVAVIVTQTLPKDMERFGEKDGVYICNFSEVRSVALLLRNALLKIAESKKGQENKGEKMAMLYDYLTGNEFNEQWKAIREGFLSMKISIQKERDAMEKLWKAREKQLEKVLLNAAHIKGSVEGIAGADAVNLNLTEEQESLLLE